MARFVSKKQAGQTTSVEDTVKFHRKRVEYAVTFEFPLRLPVTIRGEVEATSPQALAVRAVKEARVKAKTPESIAKYGRVGSWSSMVILLDRYKFMTKMTKLKGRDVKQEEDSNKEV